MRIDPCQADRVNALLDQIRSSLLELELGHLDARVQPRERPRARAARVAAKGLLPAQLTQALRLFGGFRWFLSGNGASRSYEMKKTHIAYVEFGSLQALQEVCRQLVRR